MTSTQSADFISENLMDFTYEFTSDKIFESRKALIDWTHDVGQKNGFKIVILRSDWNRITFCCERSGQFRNTKKNDEDKMKKRVRNISTKKCGCPFKLQYQKSDNSDCWKLKMAHGVHKHSTTEPFRGRSYVGSLSKEQASLVIEMSKRNVRPKEILVELKRRDVNNVSTIKHIYNKCQRSKKVIEMLETSQMQQLLDKLSEYDYIVWHKGSDNSEIVKDLLWAHPVSINLLHAFSHVLLMDSYKTNKLNLSLLEIKGVTSTNKTFVIAVAYLESKQEDDYAWALEKLRNIIDDNSLPNVILSDKELALINAIKRVFPTAKHLLCRWHINKNVLTNCKKLFAINEIWDKFIMSWNTVMLSSNEVEFTNRLNALKQEFSSYPQAIEYLTNTWLNNYKEHFISAWTDKIKHFGNLSENRVESSHAKLRKQLCFSQGNFETCWAKIHSLLELQHTNIIASFETSLIVEEDQFKHAEFEELRGFISMEALHMVLKESNHANSIGVDASKCSCIIRHTHGLPCAHEIAEFKRDSRPIPLESIDSYWRKLDLVPAIEKQKSKLCCELEFGLIAKRFDEVDDDTRLRILRNLREIANPQLTSLIDPKAKKEIHDLSNSKGLSMRATSQVKKSKRSKGKVYRNKRPKSNIFVSSFPVGLQPYINDIKDVVADGNCGFRAIADLMGFGENEWPQVRKDLLKELNSNSKFYSLLYGSDKRVKELIHALSYFDKNPPGRDRWMNIPDMGYLIASAYNIVLFHLSLEQCLTFLPLKSMPMSTNSYKTIAIGFVNNDHFVEVFLSRDHPIPPIVPDWYKFCHPSMKGWDIVYISWIEHFKRIIGNKVVTSGIIDLDSNSFTDEPVHAAAIRIQNKFRSWKCRKDFLVIQQKIVKIQAHVRGCQARKNYKNILWFVGFLKKDVLRRRPEGSGLSGFKSERLTLVASSIFDTSLKENDLEFLDEGRKQSIGSTGLISNLTSSQILQVQTQFNLQQQQVTSLATKSSVLRNSRINNFLGRKVVPMKHANSQGKPGNLYRGIRQRNSGRWEAEISLPGNRTRISLGTYDTAEEAALAFDIGAYMVRGELARPNFPEHILHQKFGDYKPLCSLVMENLKFMKFPSVDIDWEAIG